MVQDASAIPTSHFKSEASRRLSQRLASAALGTPKMHTGFRSVFILFGSALLTIGDSFLLSLPQFKSGLRHRRVSLILMGGNSEDIPRVMVFGATGKVGSELCKSLTSAPKHIECHAFTRNITLGKELLGPNVILHPGDLSDIAQIKEAMVRMVLIRPHHAPLCYHHSHMNPCCFLLWTVRIGYRIWWDRK